MVDPREHMGLAHSIAKRMWASRPWRYLEFSDVLQEAFVGLCKAAKQYDPTNGAAFSTYATQVIESVIKRTFYYNRRIARFGGPNIVMRGWMLRDADMSKPIDIEKAQQVSGLQIPMDEATAARYYGYAIGSDSSLDILVSPDDDTDCETPLVETMPDESSLVPIEQKISGRLLERAVQHLYAAQRNPGRTRTILRDRLLTDDPRLLEDIAVEWGCTRQRVHQVELDIICKLREVLQNMGISE